MLKHAHQRSRCVLLAAGSLKHVRMYGCEWGRGAESFQSLRLPPLPLHRWHCVIVQRELKTDTGVLHLWCCRALPAHYGVVIQKHSPKGPPHRISLSKACYGYRDLRQRATLHQQVLVVVCVFVCVGKLPKNNLLNAYIWTIVAQ